MRKKILNIRWKEIDLMVELIFRSHLKNVFCPDFCVGTEFQLLEIL
jgi:hypothetical protein